MRARVLRVAQAAVIVLLTLAAAAARADDADKARELFTQGNTFFDLGQFDKAIDAWQQGYQLKNDPGFLYNIAQAYRTMGDAQKAIFFYKRYLSNAPKAHNRSEVEQKISALQQQLSAQEQAKGLPPPGPFGPDNPGNAGNAGATTTPPATTATTPPPASGVAPPAVTGAEAAGTTPPPQDLGSAGTVAGGSVTDVAPTPPPHRIDLRAAVGFDAWASGLQENAQPSFAFTLAGGYTFGAPSSQFRFRLGALFGYTFLKESSGKDTFTSFLIDPTLVVRVLPKLTLMADLGLGVLSVSGLTKSSSLLATDMVTINGSQALGLVRVGAAAEYDLTQNVSVFLWPAYASSPKKQYFYQDIARFEVLAGFAYRP
ncbi:MAG TPA: tetratricopeptide repeat protein [Polyangia bacterium]|nr:tetratricopeptide repeat protein [Polyangia bacterium]